jgi:hypothetical protein
MIVALINLKDGGSRVLCDSSNGVAENFGVAVVVRQRSVESASTLSPGSLDDFGISG